MDFSNLSQEDKEKFIDSMSDSEILDVAPTMMSPWQRQDLEAVNHIDEDGFLINPNEDFAGFARLQKECWKKFNSSPQINSHVRDFQGSLTGAGFETNSDVSEIQEFLTSISEDPRNELHKRMTQYAARAEILGELFLALTVHGDGFVEIDFMESENLKGGDSNSGIIFHPKKQTMPLMYRFEQKNSKGVSEVVHVPSIYLARYPEMFKLIKGKSEITSKSLVLSQGIGKRYSKLGGFKSFIVSWDRGFLTKRNVSHIRTTIQWVNHYENLKKWEIDHKKSSGAYLWVVEMEDAKAYRTWLKLTDEQKKNTGLFAKKVPGGTLVLPPGVKLKCENPKLASISDQDTDIMEMVVSGLNKPSDMVTGTSKGSTFSGVKASRGPESDRTADNVAYFERFLRFDFWRSIFFLHRKMTNFPEFFSVKEAIDFKNAKPVFKSVKKKAYKLIDFEFPTSEASDMEGRTRALLGVRHSDVSETLGISKESVAKKLGFGSYRKRRLDFATEKKFLPKTELQVMIDSAQSVKPGAETSKTDSSNTKREDSEADD